MSKVVEFANFTLKFGEKNMADYLQEIVFPAFLDANEYSYPRWRTSYLFKDVKIGKNSTEVHAIIGRFIKKMMVKREQYLDDNNNLVKDTAFLERAPNSTFILILETHKLIYIREAENAPAFKAFENYIDRNIRFKYNKYIRKLYSESEQSFLDGDIEKKTTLVALRNLHPFPDLNIVPLSNYSTLRQFIDQFSVLKLMEVKLLTPNNEHINDEGFFKEMRRRKEAANSKTTTYSHSNTEGLDKGSAASEAVSANSGNAIFRLEGSDADGNKLVGNNHDFKVRRNIDGLEGSPEAVAQKAYSAFLNLIEQGILQVSDPSTGDMASVSRTTQSYLEGS